jgi:alanine racemase
MTNSSISLRPIHLEKGSHSSSYDASSPSVLTVDLSAIQDNYIHLQNLSAPSICSAVIKANAYGGGLIPVAKALYEANCQDFFVATLEEGIEARTVLPLPINIYVLNGIQIGYEEFYHHNHLIPVLNSIEEIEEWNSYAAKKQLTLKALLHIDTGMNRLGLSIEDLPLLISLMPFLKNIDILYVMSHLACSSQIDHPMNQKQLTIFYEKFMKCFPKHKASLSASGGFFLGGGYHFNLIRHGLNLYGVYHPKHFQTRSFLKFSLRLSARVLQIRTVSDGESIGYDQTYVVQGKRRLATIGIGYADGLPRSLSNQGAVAYIQGYEVPFVGLISMDLSVVDITDVPFDLVNRHTWVDLFYDNMSLYKLSQQANSTPHEFISRLSPRCKRTYIQRIT